MIRPMHQQYIVKGGGSLPDPSTYCPTNGYIDPTQPNDDWLILPKVYPKYGLLYNWYTTADARNISNTDWRLLTFAECLALQTYIGGNGQGGKLKETGTVYWNSPNTNATNEFGWNGRGSGNRGSDGVFAALLNAGRFWCIYDYSTTQGVAFGLNYNDGSFVSTIPLKKEGLSVRLIYTGSGSPTSYIGNNGNVYRVVTINGKIYTADNISETKYRDGSWITGFDGGTYTPITNANWAAKTTEACCAYNNDWLNV